MRTTLNIDDHAVRGASELTGVTAKTTLVRPGLKALIARESAKREEHRPKSTLVFYIALRASWVTYLVTGLTEPFYVTNVGYWFWLLGGLLIALDFREEQQHLIPYDQPVGTLDAH